MTVEPSPAVSAARTTGRAVVALESTIFSELGLPPPHNREALERCCDAVHDAGAEAAITAVLDGRVRLGVEQAERARICGPARKTAARDLPVAVGQAWAYGATTVSAAVTIAARAGVPVFATGGIGGVHRDVQHTGDVSADLDAIASHPVVTVSAGAKIFLDLGRTLEYLETASVPVLGWRCDDFPAFHARSSGLSVPHRVDSAEEVAAIARAHWDLGGGGILLVAPVPEEAALPADELGAAVDAALARAGAAGVSGPAVTPLVLAALADVTDGRSIPANLALAEHNAAVAAQVAVALTDGGPV
jgi:pseudouridylate synthase